jgi:putative methylase
MNLKRLEIELESLSGFTSPRVGLEQYGTPAVVAARLLFHAYMRGDIEGQYVCDLGCGTGVLACGAALLGATHVNAIDIDPGALETARENASSLGVEVDFFAADIRETATLAIAGPCDTVVMNPPFGAQRKHADRPFIDRSLELGSVVYGIFNAGSLPFIKSYIQNRGRVDDVISCMFPLKHTFAHHNKERVDIPVEIICMKRV